MNGAINKQTESTEHNKKWEMSREVMMDEQKVRFR